MRHLFESSQCRIQIGGRHALRFLDEPVRATPPGT